LPESPYSTSAILALQFFNNYFRNSTIFSPQRIFILFSESFVEEAFLARCYDRILLDLLGFVYKLADIREIAIYAGEPHVGDFVNFTQPAGEGIAYETAGHFLVECAEDFFFGGFDYLAKLVGADGPFVAGFFQAVVHLFPIVRLTRTVLLYDRQPQRLFHTFIRGETFFADKTLPPPPDDTAAVTAAGIYDFVIILSAEWTLHD